MTTYTVVLRNGTVEIEADTYRTPTPLEQSDARELYFYEEPHIPNRAEDPQRDRDGPIATFPAGMWDAVFESASGSYFSESSVGNA